MEFTSDLEDEIGNLPIRTSRTRLESNSDLEEEITQDLEDEIGILRKKLEIAEDEIELQFGPGGRNHLGPGGRN